MKGMETTRRRTGTRAIALVLVAALGLSACSSGPRAATPRTDERLPDHPTDDTSNIRSEMPGERQIGVVLLVLLGIGAGGGLGYLAYKNLAKRF